MPSFLSSFFKSIHLLRDVAVQISAQFLASSAFPNRNYQSTVALVIILQSIGEVSAPLQMQRTKRAVRPGTRRFPSKPQFPRDAEAMAKSCPEHWECARAEGVMRELDQGR